MARHPFPRSLGEHVAAWVELNCTHGPGDVYGQPVRLTGEEVAFLEEAYAIDPSSGRRLVDLGVYSRRKGTRKSELGAWLVAAECLGPSRAYMDGGEPVARPPVDPSVICAATTEDQGDLVYGAFRAIVKASPRLEPLFDVGLEVTYLVGRPGKIELVQSRNAAALDGARPTFEVCDESHVWTPSKGLVETFNTLRRNLNKRHAAMPWMFMPTTAYQPGEDSVAELLHRAVDLQETGRKRAGRLLHDHRQASARWDLDKPDELRMAVEEAGGDAFWSDVDGICASRAMGVTPWDFDRYWLNRPSEIGTESWLPAGAWEACREPGAVIDRSRPFSAAVDMALRRDSAACVAAQERPDGRVVVEAWIWTPQGGQALDVEAVEATVRELHRTGRMEVCGYDPAWFVRSAQVLEDESVPMEEFPQSPSRMVPACGHAYQLIVDGDLAHGGDPLLARHVLAAVPRVSGEAWRISKGKSSRPIDACVAMVMAVELATSERVATSMPFRIR